jgi:hypothetical protein
VGCDVSSLRAFDLATGEARWVYEPPAGGGPVQCDPTVALFTDDGVPVVYCADSTSLFALNAETGAQLYTLIIGGLAPCAPVGCFGPGPSVVLSGNGTLLVGVNSALVSLGVGGATPTLAPTPEASPTPSVTPTSTGAPPSPTRTPHPTPSATPSPGSGAGAPTGDKPSGGLSPGGTAAVVIVVLAVVLGGGGGFVLYRKGVCARWRARARGSAGETTSLTSAAALQLSDAPARGAGSVRSGNAVGSYRAV